MVFKCLSVCIVLIGVIIGFLTMRTIEPPNVKIEELPASLQKWFKRGSMINVFGYDMFVVDSHPDANAKNRPKETVWLVHGFPSSCHDYHRVWDFLVTRSEKRVLCFDHVGFGFSDKPTSDFSYSLHAHAENALELLRRLDVKAVHVVAHDMGDSVVTEVLTRLERNQLPLPFSAPKFFRSLTFTNGGMLVEHINFRVTQRLLLWLPQVGAALADLDKSNFVARKQLGSLWGKFNEHMDEDIECMIALNKYKGGMHIMGQLIRYLWDRYAFQPRWLSSLTALRLPIQLLWADSDDVSPVVIPMKIARKCVKNKQTQVVFMKGAGHFLMLEQPDEWNKYVNNWLELHD